MSEELHKVYLGNLVSDMLFRRALALHMGKRLSKIEDECLYFKMRANDQFFFEGYSLQHTIERL